MFDHQLIFLELEARLRRDEILRQVKQEQLLKQVRGSQTPQRSLRMKALGSLGHRLVRLGQRLEGMADQSRNRLALE